MSFNSVGLHDVFSREVVVMFFNHLKVNHRAAVKRTCKLWNALINECFEKL